MVGGCCMVVGFLPDLHTASPCQQKCKCLPGSSAIALTRNAKRPPTESG